MADENSVQDDTALSAPHEGLGLKKKGWRDIDVGSLVQGQTVVSIPSDKSVEDACIILTNNHITSAPIKDEGRGEWIGLFDYADLCSYLMLLLKRSEPMEDDSLEVKELIAHARAAQPVPVSLVSDLSQRNPFAAVYPETCLGDVMDSFGEGVHRVVVVENGTTMKGILSQSAVIKHIFKNIDDFPELKPLMNARLAELGLGLQGKVHSVQNDALVLDAVQTLVTNKVSSLAVVNSQGILTGNFSMSDVRHVLRHKKVPLLWKTVQAYLNFFDQQEGIKQGRDKFPVFDVDPQTTTLAHAMAKLVATKAHRLYTTERRSGRPVGVDLEDLPEAIFGGSESDLSSDEGDLGLDSQKQEDVPQTPSEPEEPQSDESEKPKKKRKRHAEPERRKKSTKKKRKTSPEPQDGQDDDDPIKRAKKQVDQDFKEFLAVLKPQRKRGRGGDDEGETTAPDDFADKLKKKMDEAAEMDAELRNQGQPALAKVKLLPHVLESLARTDYMSAYVDAGVLESIRLWLEPLEADGALPPLDVQKGLIAVLDKMTIDKTSLINSRIGRIINHYTKDEDIMPDVKKSCQLLVQKWTRHALEGSRNKLQQEAMLPVLGNASKSYDNTEYRFAQIPQAIASEFRIKPQSAVAGDARKKKETDGMRRLANAMRKPVVRK